MPSLKRRPGETSKPVKETQSDNTYHANLACLPTAGMSGARTVSHYPEVFASHWHGRREADWQNNRVGFSVWQIWIQEDHGIAEGGILAGESQESRKDLEERRAQGTTEATEARKIMAQRRFVYKVKTGAQGPYVEL